VIAHQELVDIKVEDGHFLKEKKGQEREKEREK
jgi:hypothetical protein